MRTDLRRECVVLAIVALAIVGVLYLVPLGIIVVGSTFEHGELGRRAFFVAGSNYVTAWHDAAYRQAAVASVAFTAASVALQVAFAFAAALLTQIPRPGVRWLRWLFVAPYFLPSVVVVIAWRFFSDPLVGPLAGATRLLGIASPDLRGPGSALAVMTIAATYEAFPFTYVVLLARLLQIPRALYEVAELDGARRWRTFFGVTLPQVRRTLVALLLLRVLITWLKFDVPWLVYASQARSEWGDTLAVAVYRTGFEELRLGKAYALSVEILSLALMAFALWVVLASRNGERRLQPVLTS